MANNQDAQKQQKHGVPSLTELLMSDSEFFEERAWHSTDHKTQRATIQKTIYDMISQRRPNASAEWLSQTTEVSQRVEKRLYWQANSLQEYETPTTLIHRIQLLLQGMITELVDGRSIGAATKGMKAHIPGAGAGAASSSSSAHKSNNDGATTSSNNDQDEAVNDDDGNGEEKTRQMVTSQGCSRVFIVKVLINVSNYVRGKLLPSIFTFDKDLVKQWLIDAKDTCCVEGITVEEGYFGGTPFNARNLTTHWTEPHQLFTWWKNNVERKNKFKILQNDAQYCNDNDEAILAPGAAFDSRKMQRARWCRLVISLAGVVRSSAGSSSATKSSWETRMAANVACRQSLDHLCIYLQANGQHLVEVTGGDTVASAVAKKFTVARILAKNKTTCHTSSSSKDNTTASATKSTDGADVNAAATVSAASDKQSVFSFHDEIDYDMDVTEYDLYRELGSDTGDESSRISFPTQLFDAVTEESKDSHGCLIWRTEDNGASFRIRDLSKFIAEGLFRLFKLRNFSSFQRLLHLHGFVRVPVLPYDLSSSKPEASLYLSSAPRAMVAAAGVSAATSSSAHMLLSLASGDTARAHTSPVATYTTPAGLSLRALRSDRYVYSHPQFHQGQRNMVGSIARTSLVQSPKMTSLASTSSSSSSSSSAGRVESTAAKSLLMYGGDGGNTSNCGMREGNFAAGEDFGTSGGHKRKAASSSSASAPPTGLVFGDEIFFTNNPLPLSLTVLRTVHAEQYRGIYQNVAAAAAAMRKRAKASKAAAAAGAPAGVGLLKTGGPKTQSNESASTEMDGCFVGNGVATASLPNANPLLGGSSSGAGAADAIDDEEEGWNHTYEEVLNALKIEAGLAHVPSPMIEALQKKSKNRRQRNLKYVRDPGVRAHSKPRSIEASASSAATRALKRYLKLTMGDAYTGLELNRKKKRGGGRDAEERKLNRERKRKLRDDKREERKRIRMAHAELRKLAKSAKREERERVKALAREQNQASDSDNSSPPKKKKMKSKAGARKKHKRMESDVDDDFDSDGSSPPLKKRKTVVRKKKKSMYIDDDDDDDDENFDHILFTGMNGGRAAPPTQRLERKRGRPANVSAASYSAAGDPRHKKKRSQSVAAMVRGVADAADTDEDVLDLTRPSKRHMLLDLTAFHRNNSSSSSNSSSSCSGGGPVLSMSLRGELIRSADHNAVEHFGTQRRAIIDGQDFFVPLHRSDTRREIPTWATAAAAAASAAASASSTSKTKSKPTKAEEVTVSGGDAKCSRIGSEYQALVPQLSSARPQVTAASNAGIQWSHTHERTIVPSATNSRSRKATSEEIDALLVDWLARRSRRAPAVGSVLVMRIPGPGNSPEGESWRLCCVLEVVPMTSAMNSSTSSAGAPGTLSVRVYDGNNQWTVPVTNCRSPGASNAENIALRVIHANGYNLQKAATALAILDHDDDDAEAMASWTLAEVELFVSGIQRFGDDMRRIWQLLASKTATIPRPLAVAASSSSSSSIGGSGGNARKSLAQVLDFYHRVYPHAAISSLAGVEGRTERLLRIYRRAERAAEGDDEEEEEEEEEVDDDEDDDDEEDEEDDDEDDDDEDDDEEDDEDEDEEEEDMSMDTDDELFDESKISIPAANQSTDAVRQVSQMNVDGKVKAGPGGGDGDDDSVSIYSIASVEIAAAATARGHSSSSSSSNGGEVAFSNGPGWMAEGYGLSFNPAAD